jgi:hypothetical protein
MLNWNQLADTKTYDAERFDLLVLLEGSTSTPYVDSIGNPTIGIGFNLVYNLKPVLEIIIGKSHWSDTLYDKLKTEVDKSWSSSQNTSLQSDLNAVMRNWHNTHDSHVPTTFSFANDAEIAKALNALAPDYDALITDWISDIPDSKERAALFSMTWNAPSLLGPNLKAAIESNDRAEAWYEIRYDSNGSAISGIANRRYVEANEFGLYDHAGKSSFHQALQTGEMIGAHHDHILWYEETYDPQYAATIKGVSSIGTLSEEIQPAIKTIEAHFQLSGVGSYEELLAASASSATVNGDGTAYDTGANDDDLILGANGANHLSGGAGKDMLIGLKGKDMLKGGAGGDLFVFTDAADSHGQSTDHVSDFGNGHDRLDFESLLTNGAFTLLDQGADFDSVGAEIRWSHAGSNTIVQADINGDGAADIKILLNGKLDLTSSDFIL